MRDKPKGKRGENIPPSLCLKNDKNEFHPLEAFPFPSTQRPARLDNMPKAPRNEHEAWATLWASLDPPPVDRQTGPTRHKGPFTYQAPMQPTIAPYRAIQRLAGVALIATLCALLTFG